MPKRRDWKEASEEKDKRLEEQRQYQEEKIEPETSEEKEKRHKEQAERDKEKNAKETSEQKKERLAKIRLKKNESD